MADLYRVLHHLDILKCNNGGLVDTYLKVKERRVEVRSDLRVLADEDLRKILKIVHCGSGCTKVVSIEQGLSKDLEMKDGVIPILANLSATTDKGCTVKVDDSLVAHLSHEEGRHTKSYLDSKGIKTIGVGMNLEASGAKERIEALGLDYKKVLDGSQELTEDQIDTLFKDDLASHEASVKTYVSNYDQLSPAQQAALTNLDFNMGASKVQEFKKFLKAVNAGDFDKAAKELGLGKDGVSPSKWATDVKAERAGRVMAQIRDGAPYAMPQ